MAKQVKETMVVLKISKTIIDGREIPDFQLNQGEFASLLVDSPEFEFKLKDFLTGEKRHPNIEVLMPFSFVAHTPYKVPLMDRLLKRNSVRHLIQREFKGYSYIMDSVLDKAQVGAGWKIRGLAGNPKGILATLITFGNNNHIIYDVSGMDPGGAKRLHQIIKEEIKARRGAAIEINVPSITGKRFIPKADKVVEVKLLNHLAHPDL